MKLLRKMLLLGVFITTGQFIAQNMNKEVDAKINIESNKSTGFITITGTATNTTEINKSLKYELSVISNSNGNNSKNGQSGRFSLEPREAKSLSTTTINFDDTGDLIILLLIYDSNGKPIGKDRVEFKNGEVAVAEAKKKGKK